MDKETIFFWDQAQVFLLEMGRVYGQNKFRFAHCFMNSYMKTHRNTDTSIFAHSYTDIFIYIQDFYIYIDLHILTYL